jgi:probable phosphoglycerate mutase
VTANLVIVRHGNTFEATEPPRRIGARTDLPLTVSGQEQVSKLAEHFAQGTGWHFDRILCAPLRRTRETAETIRSAQTDPPMLEMSDLLAEIDHGPDENMPEAAVVARIGARALAAWDQEGLAPPGWVVDRESRVSAWRRLYAEVGDGNTLLVTSNGAARFALLADAALSVEASRLSSLKLRTGAYGVIEITNAAPHLAMWDRRP